ncbi:hypothetical protein HanIR_Chr11g0543571 [Helianthus annuus]|nr:hypothetical protein HanIR_Chr11g0543571 [Helianthus annuus]
MFFKIITGTTGLLTAPIPARMGSGVVTPVNGTNTILYLINTCEITFMICELLKIICETRNIACDIFNTTLLSTHAILNAH